MDEMAGRRIPVVDDWFREQERGQSVGSLDRRSANSVRLLLLLCKTMDRFGCRCCLNSRMSINASMSVRLRARQLETFRSRPLIFPCSCVDHRLCCILEDKPGY